MKKKWELPKYDIDDVMGFFMGVLCISLMVLVITGVLCLSALMVHQTLISIGVIS